MRLTEYMKEAQDVSKSDALHLKPMGKVFDKAKRALSSSKTLKQLEVARQYYRNFTKLYMDTVPLLNKRIVAKGMFMEITKIYNDKKDELSK